MRDHVLHLPNYSYGPHHQEWLIAEVRACNDALYAGLVHTREIMEQSRKLADDAWRTLRQANSILQLLPGSSLIRNKTAPELL
jgi:hypothetical protein